MPLSSRPSYNSLSSTMKPSSFGVVIRFMTNRAVCLVILFTVFTLSLLVSITQFEINKRTVYIRSPLIMARSEILRDGDMPSFKKHHSQRVFKNKKRPFHELNLKVPNNVTVKMVKSSLEINDENLIEQPQGRVMKIDYTNSRIQDEKILLNNQIPQASSLELAFSDTAGNASDEGSRTPDDYITDHRPWEEDDGYYAEVDPLRVKLVVNVARFLKRKRQHPFYQHKVDLLPPQTKGVILLTNYRSGSTFLGELFNQHPDAFYVFEPLFPFTGGCDHDQPTLKQSFLQQILECNFPPMTDVYRQIKGPMRKNNVDMQCLLQDFCFRKNTKELCEAELCPSARKIRSCRACGPVHLPKVKNVCRRKKMSVVKVIRMCDVMQLKPILTDPRMDIKVIHLIRDPRGIESSRMKIHSQWNFNEDADMLCSRMLHNGRSGSSNSSNLSWLKGRYMKVRYENLSLEPAKMAAEIYKFVGLDFISSVKSWIKHNTQTNSSKNPYSTKRDSSKAMQGWRTHLNTKQVLTIQNRCKVMMDYYGYKHVSSEKELKDLDNLLIR